MQTPQAMGEDLIEQVSLYADHCVNQDNAKVGTLAYQAAFVGAEATHRRILDLVGSLVSNTAESQIGHAVEEAESVHMCLDDHSVQRAEHGATLSLWGRVLRFAGVDRVAAEPSKQDQVFDVIRGERAYQDRKWGARQHQVGAWLMVMQVHLTRAQAAWASADNDRDALAALRKVLGTGTACAEQHGLPARVSGTNVLYANGAVRNVAMTSLERLRRAARAMKLG